ncbi:MAG: very short patch repair endonuclease [Devosia sp.]
MRNAVESRLVDRLTPRARTSLMRNVKGKNTTPELMVRRMLHRAGYRFRLHRADLPGKPDIVLPARRRIVLVNGCFWHGHDCRYGRLPKSRLEFWGPKIEGNRARDARNLSDLKAAGWRVLVVWQCETRVQAALQQRLIKFLGPAKPSDLVDGLR